MSLMPTSKSAGSPAGLLYRESDSTAKNIGGIAVVPLRPPQALLYDVAARQKTPAGHSDASDRALQRPAAPICRL